MSTYSYSELRDDQYAHHAPENFPELHHPFTAPYTWFKARFYMEASAILVYILLKTNIHPNTITLIYGLSGLLAGAFIASAIGPWVVFGVAVFFTRGILDWSDGHLARKTGKTSSTGHILDVYGAILGSVGIGVGLGLFVATRTGYEFIYYLVPVYPILRALLLSNYGQSILLRKMMVTDYSNYELSKIETKDASIRNKSWYKSVYKAIYNFMDDRARTVDFIGFTILIDLYFQQQFSLYVFIALMTKWVIAYTGSLYLVMRGGWVESEQDAVIRSILQCKTEKDKHDQ